MDTMNNKKRVLLLLRDSTIKQDISMQRIECRRFCENRPDWVIIDEILEEGVSGYKKTAKQRKGLQSAQERALNGEYDILLVFMFDRLGRIESETPFIVKWFVFAGIEVWSTQEGQQKFDCHTDSLINFLRFWQAEGESIKISIRTRTKSSQMAEEGRYHGGGTSYGFKAEKQGRLNRKGHEVHEVVIDEAEADIVRQIFNKAAHEGYGTRRIAKWLNEQGIRTRFGNKWLNTTVQRLLRNVAYLGILKSGDTVSGVFTHLQIIDVDTFEEVQRIMDNRKGKLREDNTSPFQTKGNNLLSGTLFCGHCGKRMVQTSKTRINTLADGTVKRYDRSSYMCYAKAREIECDGKTTYVAERIDACVETLVRDIFIRAKSIPCDGILQKQADDYLKMLGRQRDAAKKELDKKQADMKKLEAELILVITGESPLSREMLNTVMENTKAEIEQAQEHVDRFTAQLEKESQEANMFKRNYDDLVTWAGLFDTCSREEKKMIISKLIHRVEVTTDYELKIEFAVNYHDLFENLFEEDTKKALISA